MQCPKCNTTLRVVEGRYYSDVNSTDVYFEQVLKCLNSECELYNTVVDTIKHKMN